MANKDGVEISLDNGAAVISFLATSISDTEGIAEAGEQIQGFIEKNQPKTLIVDFSQVKFFCSRVLGLLLELRNKLEIYGGEVVISSIDPKLHRVFTITNLDKVFRFFPDKEAAVKELGTG
jgi:anti-anti-sigma factor